MLRHAQRKSIHVVLGLTEYYFALQVGIASELMMVGLDKIHCVLGSFLTLTQVYLLKLVKWLRYGRKKKKERESLTTPN